MEEALGKVRIGPRITLSQPIIVVSVLTGVLVGVAPEDLAGVAAGLVVFFALPEGTEGTAVVVTPTLSGTAMTAGVDDAEAAARESALDPAPG